MKKTLLILIAIFSLNIVFAQTTIWIEDFENNALGTGIDGTGINGTNIGDYPGSVQGWSLDTSSATLSDADDYFKTTNDFSSRVMTARDVDGIVTWTSPAITITGYNNVTLTTQFREKVFPDALDYYKIEYKVDGAAGWTTYATLGHQTGNFGVWDEASQDGLSGNSVQIRITILNNDDAEIISFDNVEVAGYTDSNSDVTNVPPGGQAASTTIPSTLNDFNSSIEVFRVKVVDAGTPDAMPTKITNIRLKPHTSNTADWSDSIQGFRADNGAAYITPSAVTVTDGYVDISFNTGDLVAATGGALEITLYVYLNATNLVDNSILSFMVDVDDHGFTADITGSTLLPTFSGGVDFNSNDFTIDVAATKLIILQEPSDIEVNTSITPAVTAAYTDDSNNIDKDISGSIEATLSATGSTLTASTTTDGTPIDGIMTFSDIQLETPSLNVTLTITDNAGGALGLFGSSDDTSTPFIVSGPCFQLIISEYGQKSGGNYIEIYNPSDLDVDMSNYQVWRALNGGAWSGSGTTHLIALTGTLQPGDVYVVARDISEIPFADVYDVDMNYNGDDNIGLAWNGGSGTSFTLIDAVGDESGDPGYGWAVAGVANATESHILIRKETVNRENTNWTTSAGTNPTDSEWIVEAYNNDKLSYHVSNCRTDVPLIMVKGRNNNLIVNENIEGVQVTSTLKSTLFEDQKVGSTSSTSTFRIYNYGGTDLSLNGGTTVSITGDDFSIDTAPATTVSAGSYQDFIIEFNPEDFGLRTATVTIANDNPFTDNNPYTFTIQGNGVNYVACENNELSQSFQGGGTWFFATDPAPYDAEHHTDVWDVSKNLGYGTNTITAGSDGDKFWGIRDIDNSNGGGNILHTLTFNTIDVSNMTDVVVTFDYFSSQFDSSDKIEYEIKYDNLTNWSSAGISLSKNTNAWSTITIGVPPGSDFVRIQLRAKQNGDADWAAFDNIKISGNSTSTYTGGAWDNGAPTASTKAVFNDNHIIDTTDIEACECKVNSGKMVTINAGHYLLSEGNIENEGTIKVLHEGSVVQHKDDATVTGGGAFDVEIKTTSMADARYTYFSSPTFQPTMAIFDDAANSNWAETGRMFGFNGGTQNWEAVTTATTMETALGYLVRPKNSATFPGAFTTNFNTTFNTGTITSPLNNASGSGDALVGNPYPSAINPVALFDLPENASVNALYFWAHSEAGGSGNWNGEQYLETNKSGTTDGPGRIASGQGFFVDAVDAAISTITFNNSIRLNTGNDLFLRPTNELNESKLDKIWLNLSAKDNPRNVILVAFNESCTTGFDTQYDAESYNTANPISFTSRGNQSADRYGIQTRGLLTEETRVPLNVIVNNEEVSELTISIDHFENLEGAVYLSDNLLGRIHDLKMSPYQFTVAQAGEFTDRFELIFGRSTLGIDTDEVTANELIIAQTADSFKLSSNLNNIQSVSVFNIIGQQLAVINTTAKQVEVPANNYAVGTVLLLKVTFEDGSTSVKKVIKM